ATDRGRQGTRKTVSARTLHALRRHLELRFATPQAAVLCPQGRERTGGIVQQAKEGALQERRSAHLDGKEREPFSHHEPPGLDCWARFAKRYRAYLPLRLRKVRQRRGVLFYPARRRHQAH